MKMKDVFRLFFLQVIFSKLLLQPYDQISTVKHMLGIYPLLEVVKNGTFFFFFLYNMLTLLLFSNRLVQRNSLGIVLLG